MVGLFTGQFAISVVYGQVAISVVQSVWCKSVAAQLTLAGARAASVM